MSEIGKRVALPPLIQAHPNVIERGAIRIQRASIRSHDTDVLRCKVQHLPELDFTSAQSLLCSFALSDVDHSAHEFNEIAGRAQNRMTDDVNVPDGVIRRHDAVVRLPLCLLADSRLDEFSEAGLVVGMKPLKEFFESGQTVLWIETQNTIAFLRPVPDILVWTPCPTACVAESLRLRQIGLARPHRFFRARVVRNVSHRSHELVAFERVRYSSSECVNVLDSPARQQQSVGMLEG